MISEEAAPRFCAYCGKSNTLPKLLEYRCFSYSGG